MKMKDFKSFLTYTKLRRLRLAGRMTMKLSTVNLQKLANPTHQLVSRRPQTMYLREIVTVQMKKCLLQVSYFRLVVNLLINIALTFCSFEKELE